MIFDQYLDPEPNTKVTIDKDNKAVRTALKLIRSTFTVKQQRDQKNKVLRDMIEAGFEVKEPNGARKINLKMLQQAYFQTVSRMQPLDFTIHASQRPEYIEKLTRDGVVTVLKKGGYLTAYEGKGGAFQNAVSYGDSFVMFGTVGTKGFPLKFTPIPNDNVYVDARATTMRGGSKPVKKCAVIMVYTWSEFVEMWPKMAKKAGLGRIPRDDFDLKDQDQKYEQRLNEEDIVEVCYYYDIANMHYVVFAGSACTVIEEKKGDRYPFKFKNKETKQKEPYIPILHMMCMESFEGFYNHGVFEMIYDLCVLYYRILNKNANHVEDQADPYVFFSVPQGRVGEVFQKMDMAARMRAAGKRPIIPMEYDPNNPNASTVQASTPMTTQGMLNEATAIFDLIDKQLRRLGINLDEADFTGNPNQLQILAEEKRDNAFTENMMKKNAPEKEFLIKVVLDLIPEVIPKSDKTPLQLRSIVRIDGKIVKPEDLTLGELSDELAKHDYFPEIDKLSGAYSPRAEKARILNLMGQASPGSPARSALLTDLARMLGSDLTGDDFNPVQQAAPAPGEAPLPKPESDLLARRAEENAALLL